ncbi:MAG: hypothetical protein COB53_08710 [Elusimicrobia bacterium]|nr:MAG: hypothetical protein COB53_08710 [Elusimicrobiota bacterium]
MAAQAAFIPAPVIEPRIPVSMFFSVAVHVLAMGLVFRMGHAAPEDSEVVINDVELMVEQDDPEKPKARPRRRRAMKRKELAKNFFKLALPSIPKPRTLMQVDAPKRARLLIDIPSEKLKDRRMKVHPKMKVLDLSKRRTRMAKIAALPTERRARTVTALPMLSEVGRARAPRKVLQLNALRERSGAPAMMSNKNAMAIDLGAARRKFEGAGLKQAAPVRIRKKRSSLTDMLTSRRPALDLGPKAVAVTRKMPKFEPIIKTAPKLKTRTFNAPPVVKKAFDLEGEIENRRVMSRNIPRFPGWAVDQGLIEAEVRIKFYVGASGAVLEDGMTVQRSSGYGRLDRLAMGHLKRWRFESRPFGAKNEYGIITFRFLLE